LSRWADGQMGRWADGQMGRWANSNHISKSLTPFINFAGTFRIVKIS
jgi:hypothetical protein